MCGTDGTAALINFCARGACALGVQNSTERNKFHADNKIIYTKVMRYKKGNSNNVHPPQAIRKVPIYPPCFIFWRALIPSARCVRPDVVCRGLPARRLLGGSAWLGGCLISYNSST